MSQLMPERTTQTRCGVMVSGVQMSYPCTLSQGHAEHGEPHYAVEVDRSVRAWQRWKQEQERPGTGVVDGLRQHVGDPRARNFMDCGEVCLTALEHSPADPTCVMHPQQSPGPEPTKQREGDQRLPDGDVRQPDVQSQVIADIESRRQVGIERYGQGLRPFNGRDTLLDVYEESLDKTIYLRSLVTMAERNRERMREVIAAEIDPVLGVLFVGETRENIVNEISNRVTARVFDAFAFPEPAPDEVVEALGRASTPTRVTAEVRHEAAERVRQWLRGEG